MKKMLMLSLIVLFSCNRKGYQPQTSQLSANKGSISTPMQGANNTASNNKGNGNRDNNNIELDKNNMYPSLNRKMDTIIDYVCDTAPKSSSCPPYKVSEDTLVKISRLFDKDIVEPENESHPTYIRYIEKMNGSIDQIRGYLQTMVTNYSLGKLKSGQEERDSLLKRIGGEKEFKKCKIRPMLHYYLTANIVLNKGDDNLKKYYNLDTLQFLYAILKDDSLVGIMIKSMLGNNQSFVRMNPCEKSRQHSYNFIKKMHKEPFMFGIGMGIPQNLGGFGFVQNHHVIGCSINEEIDSSHIDGVAVHRFYKTFRLISAEASLSNFNAVTYKHIIKNLYKRSERIDSMKKAAN